MTTTGYAGLARSDVKYRFVCDMVPLAKDPIFSGEKF
jgi:hypothetical protein